MKILTEEICPDCKHKFESSHEMEGVEPIQNKGKIKEINSTSQTQILEQKPPEVVEKEVIKTVIEDIKPNYECPDDDCDIGIHKNKNFKKRPKGKCTNCDQFTKNDKGTCPWCKHDEIEPIEPEELDELGIDTPNIEHEGHNHE